MVLINNFSFTLLFLVCFGLSLCSLFITHKLGTREVVPSQESPIKSGSLFSREALQPSLLGFFPFFVWGALTTFFPIYALNHGMANPGLFFSTFGAMLILGRVFGGRILDLYSREQIITPSMTPYIVSMALLAFSKTLPMFILSRHLASGSFLIPTLMAYALDRGHSPGPAMGTFQAISDSAMSLGPVMMGIVIHSTSYKIMFHSLALMGIINLNYFHFFVRKKHAPSTMPKSA
jgi:MFS family permease